MSNRPMVFSPRLSPPTGLWRLYSLAISASSVTAARQYRPIGAGPLKQIVSLVAPPLCGACGSGRGVGVVVCERCRQELSAGPAVVEGGPPGLDIAVAAAPFAGPARGVVHGLKYGRRLGLAGVAAAAM